MDSHTGEKLSVITYYGNILLVSIIIIIILVLFGVGIGQAYKCGNTGAILTAGVGMIGLLVAFIYYAYAGRVSKYGFFTTLRKVYTDRDIEHARDYFQGFKVQ